MSNLEKNLGNTASRPPVDAPATDESPFSLKKTIEQKPLRDLGVQQFLKRWCQANDGIIPVYVSREQWLEQQVKGILVPIKERGSKKEFKNLYIPEDLQLWEMIGVMDAVDRDTFAHKPERHDEKKKELEKLGNTFKNAATYLAQRLDSIDEGKNIAATLAQELSAYGDSLLSGQPAGGLPPLDEIANKNLSPQGLEETDRWLAGDSLYRARQQRVDQETARGDAKDEVIEKMRQRTLRQFFRVSEKALALQQAYSADNETERPLSPLHEAFLKKINASLELQIEKPRTELMSAVFRRGLEKLYNEMNDPAGTKDWRVKLDAAFKKIGFDLKLSEQKLKETLMIDEMKKELADVRATGDTGKISEKERAVALRIQAEVSKLTYESKLSNPADIAAFQKLNCVGFTTVGMALQRELGLNILVVAQPEHSTSFLVTSDGHVYSDEMQGDPELNEIRNEDLKGTLPDGRPVTVADLVRLSRREGDRQQITFEIINNPKVQKEYAFVYSPPNKTPKPHIMNAYSADVGMQESILSNLQYTLYFDASSYEMLGEKNRPSYADGHMHWPRGADASNDNLYAAGHEANRMMYAISGGQAIKHRRWESSKTIEKFGHEDLDEREFIKQATSEKRKTLLEQLTKAHDLRHKGYIEEAAKEYRRFVSMADPEKDQKFIEKVMKHINELEQRR